MNVKRDYAGGYGVADPSKRTTYGHDPEYIVLPYMSLLYSTAIVARDGFDVSFVDGQAEGLDASKLIARIKSINPGVIVSVVNLPSIYGDLRLLKTIKGEFPETKIVAIGTVCMPLFQEITNSGAVDVVVRGDAEMVLPGLLRNLRSTGALLGEGFDLVDGVVTNKEVARIDDLDSLPEFPYHLMKLDDYWYHVFGKGVKYAPIFASRGCSYRCYYCPYPVGFGGTIVYRDPVKVVDEIERLYTRYGVRGILFRDQVFTIDWERTDKICNEIIRRGLKIEWVVETRLDRVNERILRKMKEAGCKRIHYGLESGDAELFSTLGKDGVHAKMEKLVKNFALTEQLGIGAHMFILIGLEGESWQTIRNTVETIKRIKPLTLQVAIVTPYPGTPLFEEMKEKGLLLTEDWSQYTGFLPVSQARELSASELIEARNFIVAEHRKAVRRKRLIHKLLLAAQYCADGTLMKRLMKHIPTALRRATTAVKGLICNVLVYTGAAYLYREYINVRHKNPVRILSLHRVIDEPSLRAKRSNLTETRNDGWSIVYGLWSMVSRRDCFVGADAPPRNDHDGHLSFPEFKRRILYLKRHYHFVSISDYLDQSRSGRSLGRNAVILTFDDGFKDVYTTVYPFLKKESVPFTVFVTTDFIGKDEMMLSWDDIAVMAKNALVEWGAHSVSHAVLTDLAPAEAEREVVSSKNELEKRLNRQIDVFCYPDGKFNQSVKDLLVQHGFITACSTARGLNGKGGDILALKRIPMTSEPFERFVLRMAGRT